MKYIVAVNAGPRINCNTASLIRESLRGAESEGAGYEIVDLYRLEKFCGCISCFRCKLPANRGKCVYQDGLAPVLEKIRRADSLIIGSPNYLGDVSAGFRSLYERLIFQCLTYKKEQRSYNTRSIPVLFIITSNAPEECYMPESPYGKMVETYRTTLSTFVGPTKVMICGDTLQVSDYGRYDWTKFDSEAQKLRHENVFPKEKAKAFSLGAEMVKNPW